MTNHLLTLENIRSGAVPSDAVAVGFLLGEIERLRGLMTGWSNYAWKDGTYIDDVQAFFNEHLGDAREPEQPK